MLNHKGTVTLKTGRLVLRRFAMEDAQAMYDNWASDELVPRFLSWEPHASIDVSKDVLSKWIPEYEKPDHYQWLIEFGGIPVGGLNLHAISEKSLRAEMGYSIGSRWWGRGITAEAAAAVLRFAFEEVGFNKICALHDTGNPGSGRVMQKAGMIREGHFVKHSLRKDGTWGDVDFYSIWRAGA